MPNGAGIANIVVIGVGGGGGNAINRMIYAELQNATFIAANTDMQALNMSLAPIKIQLGTSLTKGLGAGSDPEIGKRAAEESQEEIRQHIQDADLLFITAGMGGGTGTGAAPVIAAMAKEMGILTIGVVTKPFVRFEGAKRMENAEKGIEKLRESVDTLLVVPNEKVSAFVPADASFLKAFQVADDVLRQGIQGISDIITTPSLINLDFSDIKTIMKNKGNAHIGIGRAKGDNRTLDAVRQAVQSPLLETSIQGASGIIVYVAGDESLTLTEVYEAVGLIREVVDPTANIIFGMGIDKTLNSEVSVTVIATGFDPKQEGRIRYTGSAAKPIFREQASREDRMSTMYGYGAAAATPPPAEEKPAPASPEFDPIPGSRMTVDRNKDLPPFLQRMQDKRNGKS